MEATHSDEINLSAHSVTIKHFHVIVSALTTLDTPNKPNATRPPLIVNSDLEINPKGEVMRSSCRSRRAKEKSDVWTQKAVTKGDKAINTQALGHRDPKQLESSLNTMRGEEADSKRVSQGYGGIKTVKKCGVPVENTREKNACVVLCCVRACVRANVAL